MSFICKSIVFHDEIQLTVSLVMAWFMVYGCSDKMHVFLEINSVVIKFDDLRGIFAIIAALIMI